MDRLYSHPRKDNRMSEKPILFKGEMVRAIVAGDKTQTRRIIKPQPPAWFKMRWPPHEGNEIVGVREDGESYSLKCKYTQGDTIWVRENWKPYAWDDGGIVTPLYQADNVIGKPNDLWRCHEDPDGDKYNDWWMKITDELEKSGCLTTNEGVFIDTLDHLKWRPSIFLPRSMCRILLEVVSVRVERVAEISHADALAEGINPNGEYNDYGTGSKNADQFAELWDSINAKKGFGWKVNPWVWVIEFKRIEVKN